MQKVIGFVVLFFVMLANVFAQSSANASYIAQLENGKSIDASKERFSLFEAGKYTAKQLCDVPMNLWLITPISNKDISLRSLYNALDVKNDVLYLNENRPLTSRSQPNDPLYKNQWQYNNTGDNSNGGTPGQDIKAEIAWDITTGGLTPNGDTIVVAVVDDGIGLNHPDLIDNIWINHLEIPNDNIDNDGNGYIDDIHGWNAGQDNNDVSGGGHGTPVSGLVGAKGNNNTGVTGVNWNVKIMTINYGIASEAYALAAYAYAYKMRKLYNTTNGSKGAFVVVTNSSWGRDFGMAEDAPFWCAMYDSLGSVGILSAGAAPNANINVDVLGDLPTSCPSDFLISVTNLTNNGVKAGSAGFGIKSVDLGAYGSNVYTLAGNNSYGSFSGTSASCPLVSGAVALLYAVPCTKLALLSQTNPAAACRMVKDILLNNTSNNEVMKSLSTTGGSLDIGKAATAMMNLCSGCSQPSAFEVIHPTPASSTLVWSQGASTVDIRYKKIEESNWQVHEAISNPYVFNNLDYCASYVYQIKFSCENDSSDWTYLRYFDSGGCCEAPKNLDFSLQEDKLILTSSIPASLLMEYTTSLNSAWDTLYFETTATLENLQPCNRLFARFSTFCPIQGVYSNPSDTMSLFTSCGVCTNGSYCRPFLLDNELEWIDSISIGEEVFGSGKDELAYGTHFGTIVPEVLLGDSTSFNFVPGFDDAKFSEFFIAFIDWNQDFNFSEDEIIAQSAIGSKLAFKGKFFVPENAKTGPTRLRVVMSYENVSGPCKSTVSYGESEDYCITVKEKTAVFDLTNDPFKIAIYPNPNKGSFMLRLEDAIPVKEIILFNDLGKIVYTQKIDDLNFGKVININLDLPSAAYMVGLTTASDTFFKRIVVQH